MKDAGFVPMSTEMCLFKHEKLGVLVLIYVDDILIAGPTLKDCETVRDLLAVHFELKEMGLISKFLELRIRRNLDTNQVFINPEEYIRKNVSKYGKETTKYMGTPWKTDTVIPPSWESVSDILKKRYLKQTGSLNYASINTRPDIVKTISILCEANSNPGKTHLEILKHLWRYLASTASFGITLGRKHPIDDLKIRIWADAAFADVLGSRKSTGAHIASSTEAEFINLTPAGLTAIWIAKLLEELGYKQPKPILLHTDSANARANALNPLNAARTRHIDNRYKWIINRVQMGYFTIVQVGTNDMQY
ncbi:Uu.00g108190.m01.CDS01 [Anthostomella pinea]|uniref:Uu.00g108190.m01.CDS01 n=1 Tax=Anthostomella pinea TaxID=933095 RepID=A0AAI8V9C1_9PEZI|nr:Uu.00g108190.m01.CDS01 [Anthostomella pinea]